MRTAHEMEYDDIIALRDHAAYYGDEELLAHCVTVLRARTTADDPAFDCEQWDEDYPDAGAIAALGKCVDAWNNW